MPDDKKEGKATFWSPRTDPSTIKPSDGLTFDRPRTYDFSDVAWKRQLDFWYQKEPVTEYRYKKKEES